MMRPLLLAVAVLLSAASVGWGAYLLGVGNQKGGTTTREDSLTWMVREFELTRAQEAAIREVHQVYTGRCEEHCEAIRRARTSLKEAMTQSAEKADRAERQLQELTHACEREILQHVRQVAALMSPRQGERYLRLVLPEIAVFDHNQSLSPELGRHRH